MAAGIWAYLILLLKAMFTCNHGRANAVEGKTFCPDCGEGLLCRWVVYKCAMCGHRRPTGYLFRAVVTAELCCRFCGAQECDKIFLENPEVYQLNQALLSIEAVHEQEDGLAHTIYQAVKATLQDSIPPASPWLEAPKPMLPSGI